MDFSFAKDLLISAAFFVLLFSKRFISELSRLILSSESFDPYQINGKSLGFEIYRANFKTKKWFSVPFDVKGNLDIRMLPEILEFMNPIIEGKPAYLEYDE
ncbi:MAG: hypothetical protein ACTSXM_09935 [Promethearchaeota archaeon]